MNNHITAVKFHGVKISHVLVNEKWVQLGDSDSSTDYMDFGSKFIHMVGVSVNSDSVDYLFKLGNPVDATIEDLKKTIQASPVPAEIDDMHEALRIIQKNYLYREFYTLTFNRDESTVPPVDVKQLMPLMYWLFVIILLIVVGILVINFQRVYPSLDWTQTFNQISSN